MQDSNKDFQHAWIKALKYIARRSRSSEAVRIWLSSKLTYISEDTEYISNLVSKVITQLQEYGYLNDRIFAEQFITTKLATHTGKRKLTQDLIKQGINRDLISEILDDTFSVLSESEILEKAILKYIRTYGSIRTPKATRRLVNYLLRHGFGYDLIKPYINWQTSLDLETND